MNNTIQPRKVAEKSREQEMQRHVEEERRRNLAEMHKDSGRNQLRAYSGRSTPTPDFSAMASGNRHGTDSAAGLPEYALNTFNTLRNVKRKTG